MRLVIASNNEHKIREIKSILSDFFDEILSMREADMDVNIPEDGSSFSENALIKARYVMKKLGCASLADDSGLEVFTLNSRPGIYSARYAGEPCDDEANNDELLKELEGEQNRKAQYFCAIALCRPQKTELLATGTCPGEILKERVGENGFGYDPLFYIEALGKTMAELSMDEKNKISHRNFALQGLKSLIENEKQ